MNDVKIALTIAGSDSGGGAGIQADLKTFQELGTFGTSVLTAVTAQNTLGVQGVYPVPLEGILQQLSSVFSDLRPHALKTGMLYSAEIVTALTEKLQEWGGGVPVICDPVMIAKGGMSLLKQEAQDAIRVHLFPLCTLVTPNVPEAEVLTGFTIRTVADMVRAGRELQQLGAENVLVKGGHMEGERALDVLVTPEEVLLFHSPRIDTKETHGTGCTYSAAITANLAKGMDLTSAIHAGKAFVHAAIAHPLHLGGGHGPTNHHAFQAAADPFAVVTKEQWEGVRA